MVVQNDIETGTCIRTWQVHEGTATSNGCFEVFSNLELGILGYFYHQKVEFLGILASKLGISWDFTVNPLGFHGILMERGWGLYIVGVIFVGFVTIVITSWEMIELFFLTTPIIVAIYQLLKCVKELDPPCSWYRNPTNLKTNSVPSKFTIAIVKSKSPSFNALGPFDQWRKGASCAGTKHLHGPSQLVSG